MTASAVTGIGELIKAATQEQLPVVHPENPDIKDVTIAQLSGAPAAAGNHRRNADREPHNDDDQDNSEADTQRP